MKLLSLRRDWTSRFWFGGPYYHRDGPTYDGPDAIAQLKADTVGKRILLLVHGFNVDVDAILPSYDKVAEGLAAVGLLGPNAAYQVIIGVLWPGHTAAGFAPAIYNANSAGKRLRDILCQLRYSSIALESHSLGARVILKCANGMLTDELILTSAAVSQHSLAAGKEFYQATTQARSVQVCYSERDPVLSHWYRYFEMVLHWLQLTSGDTALGLNGPSNTDECCSNVGAIDFSAEITEHSGWTGCEEWYDRWAAWKKG